MNSRLPGLPAQRALLLLLTLVAIGPVAARAGTLPGPAPTFGAAQNLSVNVGATMVAQGDFNGDGNMDIASTNFGAGTFTVTFGPGFTVSTPFFTVGSSALSQPIFLAAADFNKDGKPDLVIVNKQDNSATVEINTTATPGGTLTFTRTVISIPPGTNIGPLGVATADVNGDGNPDFATANFSSNNFTVFFGDGAGGFGTLPSKTYLVPIQPSQTGSNPNSIAFGDLNRDGKPDAVIAANVGSLIYVYLGNGTADPFTATPVTYTAGANPVSAVIADVNADRSPDVIVSANGLVSGDDAVSIFFGNGDGTLGTVPCASGCGPGKRLDLPGVGSSPQGVAVGDVNGDSYPDIVIVDDAHGASDGLRVFLGNGLGCFGNTAGNGSPPPCGSWLPVTLIPGSVPKGVAIGDVNGDGKPDLYVANSSPPASSAGISLFTNTLAGAAACAASQSPPNCVSNRTPCISMDVNISGATLPSGAVRGFSVTIKLSSNLSLCQSTPPSGALPAGAFVEGEYLSTAAPGRTEFHVTDNGGGSYTLDNAILDPVGTPPTLCGPTTQTGRLFSVNVTAAPGTLGTGSITVTGFTLRNCTNDALTAFVCPTAPPPSGTITIKRVDPLPATALSQVQRKTGNGTGGTTGITVSWTLPTDPNSPASSTAVDVWRAPFLGTGTTALLSGYPDYQGAAPSLPGGGLYPIGGGSTAPWVKATTLAASGAQATNFVDTGAPSRGYWYYVVVRVDQCNNTSTLLGPPAAGSGTLNYHLGDVTTGTGVAVCQGDNAVTVIPDLTQWATVYGGTIPLNDAQGRGCWDFGPTGASGPAGTVDQRPRRDTKINFDEQILWAINKGGGLSAPQLAALPAAADHDEASVVAPASVRAGEQFEVALRLKAAGDLKGLSTQLAWNAAVAEPMVVSMGELGRVQEAVVLSAGPGNVDAVVPGSDRPGFVGDGVLATVTFRARADGDPAVVIAKLDGRDLTNRQIFVSGAGASAPLRTEFAPIAPNPFHSNTTLAFTLAVAGRADLAVYSVDGRRVRTMAQGVRPAGAYRLTWDGADDGGRAVQPGVYFARLVTAQGRFARTLVLMR